MDNFREDVKVVERFTVIEIALKEPRRAQRQLEDDALCYGVFRSVLEESRRFFKEEESWFCAHSANSLLLLDSTDFTLIPRLSDTNRLIDVYLPLSSDLDPEELLVYQ